MGPGAQQDTLDDYFGDSNWKKVVKLGHTMLHKLKDALPEQQDHHEALDDFEEGLRAVTMASVQLELARDDQNDIQMGTCLALHKGCTPSVLISTGLELEEQQQQMKADRTGLGVHASDNQEGKLLQQNNTLQCRIDTWTKLQELYMPSLAALCVSKRSVSGDIAAAVTTLETIKLWLPSQIGRTAPCDIHLQTIEWKLHYMQAHNALHSLYSNLCAQTAILKYKDRNLCGQGANMRAQNTLKAVEARIDTAASTYEHAHKALIVLAPLLNQTG
ncbi:uncharacterized protein BJ212DRAFT_1482617 [Suillus subaureus]|uniref:Uncharacterized protein n=1 Tax=Suillus subaureus TaxID=48587 RepID=A0A9P7E711_9AGAM|nr:uncharacterized protein BJ212DRAFT_1482617 [Suillus subaureus]KAG1813148.1 hypothetical protein BJ212DRAFT_1482617 [Suillus subaureus]